MRFTSSTPRLKNMNCSQPAVVTLNFFHATENSKGIRKRVSERTRTLTNIKVHTIWIDKSYTAPVLQEEVALFSLFGKAMGKWIGTVIAKNHGQVVMVFDSVLTGKQQDSFNSTFISYLPGIRLRHGWVKSQGSVPTF
jgi:hypothetical protein